MGGFFAAPGPRIVRGAIYGDGSIAAGTGFTVNHLGTGDYVITYDAPFPADPIVMITPAAGGVLASVAGGGTGAASEIFSTDLALLAVDIDFLFVAVET
jgi:hypothetical protein